LSLGTRGESPICDAAPEGLVGVDPSLDADGPAGRGPLGDPEAVVTPKACGGMGGLVWVTVVKTMGRA
jgi:hypothetical protein